MCARMQCLSSVSEILESNGIQKEMFVSSIKEHLEKGRGNFPNAMISGPANCAKSFILSPVTSFTRLFFTFSSGKYHICMGGCRGS